jgi:putative restriction endonuclease
MTRHRLGQGAFRVLVTDAYHRRCAVTGEKTLPVLKAAHIKPYADRGPHVTNNGILLKSDFHTLFDKGYITIDRDYRLDVSPRLQQDYGNGRDYYKYHGQRLFNLPDQESQRPGREFLEWHNENVFLG